MAKRILFQGDSITDCSRDRQSFYSMGNGFANMVKAALGTDFPGEYEFVNRGIAGNRVAGLFARNEQDFIKLQPDYASIFVGINDVAQETQREMETGRYEKVYTLLLEEILEACPQIKLMLIAPYVLPGTNTNSTEELPHRYERYTKGVAEKTAVARRLAEKFGLPLIELQPAFEEACKKAPAEYWSYDGVHPTACGHELIKRLWLETFYKIK